MAEIKLKTEKYDICRTVAMKFGRAVIDEPLIVPDVKPDIKKILDVSARAYVTDVTPGQDKAHVEGTVKASLLYLPDGDVIGTVKSLEMSRDFSVTVDSKSMTPDDRVSAEAEIDSLDSTLINSRKVNIRIGVNVGVKICRQECLELPVAAEEEESAPEPPLADLLPLRRGKGGECPPQKNAGIQLKKTPLRIADKQFTSDGSIIVRGKHEISGKLPQIGEVLCANASVEPERAVMADGCAELGGSVKVSVLYEDEADPGENGGRTRVRTVEFSIPYNESFDAPKAIEDMECDVEYNVREIYTEVMDNMDGERREIGAEIVIGVVVSGYIISEPGAVSDGYCTGGGELVPEFSETAPEQIAETMTAQISHKCALKRRPSDAEITGVSSMTVTGTSVDDIDIGDGTVKIKGSAGIKALCLSNDENQPLLSLETKTPFEHSFDIDGGALGSRAACDAKVFVNHLSYNITGPDTVEARMIIGISVKLIKNDRIKIVTSFERIEPEADQSGGMQSYIIYFVQPGDTLWNIAKRYKTTVDDIVATSGITNPDKLRVGQKIRLKA